MAGEIWHSRAAIGKQTDPNIAVPATRRLYLRDPLVTKEADSHSQHFATGGRDNVRAHRKGPYQVGGSFVVPVSSDELVEPMLMTLDGTVVPTQPNVPLAPSAYSWKFKPGPILTPVTLEYNDGANDFGGVGLLGNSFEIAGSVNDENLATFDLFGRDRILAALTPALPGRLPTFFEGWEVELYIDPEGATPGTTLITDALISWKVKVDNKMTRKYFGQNTKLARGINMGEVEITASIVFEAVSPFALAEMARWENDELCILRLAFGQNVDYGGGVMSAINIDMPGAWMSHDASGDDEGSRTYEMELTYVYDETMQAGIEVELVNERAVAFAA